MEESRENKETKEGREGCTKNEHLHQKREANLKKHRTQGQIPQRKVSDFKFHRFYEK